MKFIDEFKEFIAKGNVMDMAVGVVIGGAFKGIVDSLVKDVINPFIAFCVSAISKAAGTVAVVAGVDEAEIKPVDISQWAIPGTEIKIGGFLSAVINFLIMAFIIFCLVKTVNKIKSGFVSKKEEPKAPAGPTQEQLLEEIRDLLKEAK
ncbi:MAG: large conductance mechanosensitive channel protein MscL [Clostridiales bacterium]|nr:large conductance mechanosensitive channel protein MscL [Clostridiales bacterium]